ncbi:hypothetical protein F5B17DRAFT_405166 [Nemania serpens]|nr:hypothetical protein F5B17DRAFT_405166 [Nemania serpens]
MYITKIFLSAMLALSGLAQARQAFDEGAIEARAAEPNMLAARDDAAFAIKQDPKIAGADDATKMEVTSTSAEELDARHEAEESQRSRCRSNEYWDDRRRRCRRCRRFRRGRCDRF